MEQRTPSLPMLESGLALLHGLDRAFFLSASLV